eukprot:COSAG04_NODE_16350_length_502_cov_0.774194_2_plen_87_part_00
MTLRVANAGPDGGVLPPSDSCEFHYNTDQAGGCAKCGKAKRWGIPIMKDPANPAGQAQCDNSTRETSPQACCHLVAIPAPKSSKRL